MLNTESLNGKINCPDWVRNAKTLKFYKSFYFALKGLVYVLASERNARIHLILAVIALAMGIRLNVSNLGLAAIFFAIVLVFLAEIINTAFEKTLDLIDKGQNLQIKLIKDMAAGAVLVTSVAALLIGIIILLPPLLEVLWRHR